MSLLRSFFITLIIILSVIFCFYKSDNLMFTESTVPSHWNDTGMFSRHYELAYSKMRNMSLEEKIGQILLVRLPSSNVEKVIEEYKVGGFVFYEKDIKAYDKQGLSTLIKNYNNKSTIPLLIAIDEEGGSVVRLSCNKKIRNTPFKSPQKIFIEEGYSGIIKNTREMCELLGGIGFNVNLAPVADISTNPKDYIYKRSFGKGAKETSEFIRNVIETSRGTKLSFTIKHFPGLGSNSDTHRGIVIDKKSISELKSKDLLPFMSGIAAGADSIMISHNVVTCLDNKQPASLSKNVINFARSYMNYTGIIMTDNVDMKAIREFTNGTGVVEAILAGNDVIMVSDYKRCVREIKEALQSGKITLDMIDYMVFKVLAWKYYKGLIN